MRQIMAAAVVAVGVMAFAAARAETTPPMPAKVVDQLMRLAMFNAEPASRNWILAQFRARGNPDIVAALIQSMRFVRDDGGGILASLYALTGEKLGDDWKDWMLWQEAHPEITPYEGFDGFKADVMATIDENFRLFLQPGVKHEIRLEEIAWGGVVKDGIPALVNPPHITPAEADYLLDEELVFGVQINGDARAYPLRIMNPHEMFNDVVGGVPVALAYCTLCGSGILYETKLPDRAEPFVFGSSGFLYRSNKLMYDRETNSLWNQFTGRPVVGELTGSGIVLKVLPVAITKWRHWLERHPDTKVLSLRTGHVRDYRPGAYYKEYFASPTLMFPAVVGDKRLKPKDQVFALRVDGADKAWPLTAFAGGRVINDRVGERDIVLIGDADSHTVRAYDAGGRTFAAGPEGAASVVADGESWRVEEEALVAGAARLARLPGHIAYWFAWSGFTAGAPLYDG